MSNKLTASAMRTLVLLLAISGCYVAALAQCRRRVRRRPRAGNATDSAYCAARNATDSPASSAGNYYYTAAAVADNSRSARAPGAYFSFDADADCVAAA